MIRVPDDRDLVVVSGLRYRYPPIRTGGAPIEALRDIDLVIGRGECVALVGPVGSGKSTLCQAIAGLVPHAWGGEFGGRVVVDGLDTRIHGPDEICRRVGIVFQDAESQLFCSTVEDEVAFAPEGLALERSEIEHRINWSLKVVGLIGMRERSPRNLSGGQQQRLTLAAVMAARPRLLVLDEAAASLDPRGASDIYSVLAELRKAEGLTMLIAEQDIERVAAFADRVAVLDGGRLVALDTPGRAFATVEARAVVEPPPITALSAQLRAVEPDLPEFSTIDEAESVLAVRLATPFVGGLETEAVSNADPVGPSSAVDRSQTPIVEIRDLWHVYEGGYTALAGVTLAIPEASRLALVGPNGSGKTTLARHLIGLLRPTRGSVRIAGADASKLSVGELAATVGYVFQNPDHQIFAPTVRDELAFGPRQLGIAESEVRSRVDGVLDFLGLQSLQDDPPASLGYGLRRLVGLAGVLTLDPRILVLDEPFTGLDWRAISRILDRLIELNDQGRTIVLITHDMRVVSRFANRIVGLIDGHIKVDASPRELFTKPDLLMAAGLTCPSITQLAIRLRDRGLRPDSLTVDEFATDYLSRRADLPRDPGRGVQASWVQSDVCGRDN